MRLRKELLAFRGLWSDAKRSVCGTAVVQGGIRVNTLGTVPRTAMGRLSVECDSVLSDWPGDLIRSVTVQNTAKDIHHGSQVGRSRRCSQQICGATLRASGPRNCATREPRSAHVVSDPQRLHSGVDSSAARRSPKEQQCREGQRRTLLALRLNGPQSFNDFMWSRSVLRRRGPRRLNVRAWSRRGPKCWNVERQRGEQVRPAVETR